MPFWILSALGWARKAFQAVLSLVTRYPWQSAVIALLVATAWLWRANSGLHDAIKAERAAHAATVANFKKAQADATALQAHNLARVAKVQQEITDETVKDYRADAATWAGRFERLRANVRNGSPCTTGMPAVSEAASGIDGPDHNTGHVAVKVDDLETLVNNSLRGKALQDWVDAQAKVETSE